MTLPVEKEIRLPLLRVIEDAGGELPMLQAIVAVEQYFPDITEEDKQLRRKSGPLAWRNRVQWVRQALVVDGYLYREPRGIWRITPEGRQYLSANWRGPGVSNGPEGMGLHKELETMVAQIAGILAFHAETEYSQPPYRYDVVWKSFQAAPRAEAVFEIQDKGNLIEALAKLQHARDIWGSRLFLVVTGEKDQKKVHQLTGTFLSGTFHRLAPYLTVLTPREVRNLSIDLGKHAWLLQKLLQA